MKENMVLQGLGQETVYQNVNDSLNGIQDSHREFPIKMRKCGNEK